VMLRRLSSTLLMCMYCTQIKCAVNCSCAKDSCKVLESTRKTFLRMTSMRSSLIVMSSQHHTIPIDTLHLSYVQDIAPYDIKVVKSFGVLLWGGFD